MTPIALRILSGVALTIAAANTASAQDPYFNSYVIRAYEMLKANYGGLGYGQAWFTHNIDYGGKPEAIKATNKPETMCNAAVTETLLEAINIYVREHPKTGWSRKIFPPRESWTQSAWSNLMPHLGGQNYLDRDPWKRYRNELTPSLKEDIKKFHSLQGMPKALAKFGLGEEKEFREARPGDVIAFDRDVVEMDRVTEKPSGHAVIFLAFITRDQTEVTKYKGDIVGFKYFSSQSSIPAGSRERPGLGERRAYFKNEMCPFSKNYTSHVQICKDQEVTDDNKRKFAALKTGLRDCCVKRGSLRVGRLLMPHLWSYNSKQATVAREDRELIAKYREFACNRLRKNEQVKLIADAAVAMENTDPQLVGEYFKRVNETFHVKLKTIGVPDLSVRVALGIVGMTPAAVKQRGDDSVDTAERKNLRRRVQQACRDQMGLVRSNAEISVPNQALNGISSD
jgi:hypothetical protein